ncbi:MAG: hypothetical protein AUI15_08730 [Actinobacteria bacterium 13_2_20CM_2_66_6]|nr:MAG: hypothetical protein AUI15_08730 [Actinobacteria bacterium 13_2_20CM_2_66_6]
MERAELRRRILHGAWIGALVAVACLVIALALLWPRCQGGACPSVSTLETYRPPQASEVLDRDGRLIARLAPEQRIVVPVAAIPPRVTGAFLAVEDRRFYQHRGIDFHRMMGALWRDLRTFSLREGSSTITMQLARNIFPQQIGPARTLRRKLWELVLAREIEQKLPKDRILELYLNQIYLGNGLYGIEAAARGYFGKPVGELTAAQAATLAALPKAPTTYDPRRYPDAARRRRDLVLRLMAEASVISPDELRKALREKLHLSPPEETSGAPWFVAGVRRELHDRFGAEADTMGLRVRTGLDPGLQKAAEHELARQIGALEHRRKKPCNDDHSDCLEGLFVALDPVTGAVLALVGGRDYAMSEFDRATQARRQPGSAFKPIVWAAALESGIPLSTLLAPDGGDYQPADRITLPAGPLNLREALRVSSNRAAVALGNRVGIPRVIEQAHALGITTPIPEFPSTLLGAGEVAPIELAAVFAAFANGGDQRADGRGGARDRRGRARRRSPGRAAGGQDGHHQRRAGRLVRGRHAGAIGGGVAGLRPPALARAVGLGRPAGRTRFRPHPARVLPQEARARAVGAARRSRGARRRPRLGWAGHRGVPPGSRRSRAVPARDGAPGLHRAPRRRDRLFRPRIPLDVFALNRRNKAKHART